MSTWELVCCVLGGYLAGVINTLAGSGSTITLGLMTELLGLNPGLANGTNRIGIFLQGLASLEAFQRNKKLPWQTCWQYLVCGIAGAIVGVYAAITISAEQFQAVYKILMLLMFGLIFIHPDKWIKQNESQKKISAWIYVPVFFALGFYGGFIQLGMGIFFLSVMVLVVGMPLVEANAVKVLMVTTYTVIVILIFQSKSMINWNVGLTIGFGQALGGWVTAQYASTIPNANKWAYYLLVTILSLTLIHLYFF
ncbi:MAG TPA: sulfite exporter TauE/SafE family protein [Saprospiraceae bacterium]|nr:sulfite exporter TauE/SafE family protein [Saprospiraceae bacterium]